MSVANNNKFQTLDMPSMSRNYSDPTIQNDLMLWPSKLIQNDPIISVYSHHKDLRD